MSYRDRPIKCPRCQRDLERADVRDRWRCPSSHGVLFAVPEVIRELVDVHPELAGDGHVRDLTTLGRRTDGPARPCPACGGELEPVFLGGVAVDRCFHDQLLWFDGEELAQVLSRARDQREEDRGRRWLARLFGF